MKANHRRYRSVRVWFQDESRFGLITEGRRKITLKGVKPVGKRRYERQSFYLYGAVEPQTGQSLFLELPKLNREMFQLFLTEMSRQSRPGLNLVYLDGSAAHWAAGLEIPKNIRLLPLPPYSPELNPQERVWQALKAEIAWRDFQDLDAVSDWVCQQVQNITPEQIQSLTQYPYIRQTING